MMAKRKAKKRPTKTKKTKAPEAPVAMPEIKPPITVERDKKAGVTLVVRTENQIKLVSKIPKRNTFMSDKYRDERDTELFNVEISKREHKGKIKTVTRIKQMEVDADGFWITECIIDLKE